MNNFQILLLKASTLDCTIEEAIFLPDNPEFEKLKTQLEQGVPLEYLTKFAIINDKKLHLDFGVLLPREETIEYFQNLVPTTANMVDLGTGSGLISWFLEDKFETVWALDVSQDALKIATKNLKKSIVLHSDLLTNLPKNIKNWTLIANLPYVPISDLGLKIQNNISFEPELAIFSGLDGLDLFRQTCIQLKEFEHLPTICYFELDPRNIFVAETFFNQILPNYQTEIALDCNNLSRFLVAKT